jgi:hypothetical protein
VPIEGKESMRRLSNMGQSVTLIGGPAGSVHIGDREKDIYVADIKLGADIAATYG